MLSSIKIVGLFGIFALFANNISTEQDPNISGYYRIQSVVDDTFITGYYNTSLVTTQYLLRVEDSTLIWRLVQQNSTVANETNYFIIIGSHGGSEHPVDVPLIQDDLFQRWTLAPVGRNLWIFLANNTDKCLTNNGENQIVTLSSEPCQNKTNQMWVLLNLETSSGLDYTGVYYLQSFANGKYVTGYTNSSDRFIENHVRNNTSKSQEWRIIKRAEFGNCYEIRSLDYFSQLIPLRNSTSYLMRLPMVWEFEPVGLAKWKIKQLNTDNCLGFIHPLNTNMMELANTPCDVEADRQVWFLLQLESPENVNEGSRKCVAINSSEKNVPKFIYILLSLVGLLSARAFN